MPHSPQHIVPPTVGATGSRASASPMPQIGQSTPPGMPMPPQPSTGGVNIPNQPGVGQTPTNQLDSDIEEWLKKILAPAPQGVEADIGNGMRLAAPGTPEEKEQRRAGWKSLFDKLAADPNAQQALLTAAAQILQPIQEGSGETALSRLVQGSVVGTSTYDQLQQQDVENEQQQTENELRQKVLEQRVRESELSQAETAMELQAQENLIRSVRDDPNVDPQDKERFEALARSGNTKAALDLIAEKNGDARILTPDEIVEMNPNIDPSKMVVAQKSNGDFVFTELPGEANADQRDRKIQDLAQVLEKAGQDSETAQQNAQLVTDGVLSIQVSDDGTQATLVNPVDALTGKGTGAQTVFRESPKPAGGDESSVPTEETLFGETAEKGVGISSFYNNILANIPSPLKGDTTEEQQSTVKARQRLKQFSRQVIQARILNPRFAVGEQEMIREETDISPSLLTNPSALRDRMRALDTTLRLEVRQAEQDLKQGVYSGEEREKLRASIRGMKNARESMGVDKMKNLLKSLDSPEKVKNISNEEFKFLMLSARDDELLSLGDDVLQALLERKRQLTQGQ